MSATKKQEKKSQKKLPKSSLPNTKNKIQKQIVHPSCNNHIEVILPEQVAEIPIIEQQLIGQLPPELQRMPGLSEEILKQLASIPPEKLKKGVPVSLAVRKTETSVHHSGPVPHPAILEGYERVAPGLAERIVVMAEKAQNKNHDRVDAEIRKSNTEANILSSESQTSRKLVTAQIILSFLGTLFIALFIFLVLGFSAYCAYIGKTGPAWSFGVGCIVSIIVVFKGYLKIPDISKKK